MQLLEGMMFKQGAVGQLDVEYIVLEVDMLSIEIEMPSIRLLMIQPPVVTSVLYESYSDKKRRFTTQLQKVQLSLN